MQIIMTFIIVRRTYNWGVQAVQQYKKVTATAAEGLTTEGSTNRLTSKLQRSFMIYPCSSPVVLIGAHGDDNAAGRPGVGVGVDVDGGVGVDFVVTTVMDMINRRQSGH